MRVVQDKHGGDTDISGAIGTTCRETTLDANLNTFCTVIYCTANDFPSAARSNARRIVTYASCSHTAWRRRSRPSAAIAGSSRPRKRFGHLHPRLPRQTGYFKRRRRLCRATE
jgi:hypothetical protein